MESFHHNEIDVYPYIAFSGIAPPRRYAVPFCTCRLAGREGSIVGQEPNTHPTTFKSIDAFGTKNQSSNRSGMIGDPLRIAEKIYVFVFTDNHRRSDIEKTLKVRQQ